MKAEIAPLEIPASSKPTLTSNSSKNTQSNQLNSRKTLLFIILFILNVFAIMDMGAIIPDIQFNYFYCLYPLSFIGNVLCSFLSTNLMHRISSKRNMILSLTIMLSFFLLTITSKFYWLDYSFIPYLILISRGIISLMQSSLAIFSIQWCQYFSNENSRLIMIQVLQLTPLFGITFGFIAEVNYEHLSFYIQITSISLILLFLIFIPTNQLENRTKHLTDEFLRRSLTKGNAELLVYIPMIFLQISVSTLCLFIFSMIFFHKANQIILNPGKELNAMGKIITFTVMTIIGPFIGLIMGGYTLSLYNRKHSVWLILLYSILGLAFSILFNLLNKDVLIQNSCIGLMLLFNMASLPFVISSISNMIISKETREWVIAIIVSSSTLLGLGLGAFIGEYFNYLLDALLFYFSIAFFTMFLIFFIVYMYKMRNDTLQNAEFFKYQIFLLISFTFNKLSLFIWDDYLGESIVHRRDVSFTAQSKSNVDVLYESNAMPNENLIQEDNEKKNELINENGNPNGNEHNKEGNIVSNSNHNTNNNNNNSGRNSRESLRPSQMTFDNKANTNSNSDNNNNNNKDNSFIFESNANMNTDGFSFKNYIFNDLENK